MKKVSVHHPQDELNEYVQLKSPKPSSSFIVPRHEKNVVKNIAHYGN